MSNTAVQNNTYNTMLGGRQGYNGAYSHPQKEKKYIHYYTVFRECQSLAVHNVAYYLPTSRSHKTTVPPSL